MSQWTAFKLPVAESWVLGELCNIFQGKSGELRNALNDLKSDKKAHNMQRNKQRSDASLVLFKTNPGFWVKSVTVYSHTNPYIAPTAWHKPIFTYIYIYNIYTGSDYASLNYLCCLLMNRETSIDEINSGQPKCWYSKKIPSFVTFTYRQNPAAHVLRN